ncbi:CBS domain-containing protein [Sulfitobacter albidus]|uniref:CBS domain-containing protein n=1 Tax=Sulfitobacter albidus TaxID=2829501 RepID=A0A975JF95_9RHOB|nr:CBS domain-containing protein [Sulfitobacter albidus]QUJ77437.1 CBS domain-containing protein [Sulfitobacter albidus]
MLVSQILSGKTSDTLVTALPSITLSEAAARLGEAGIGTLLISRDGATADGILSERDIVRQIGKRGAACLSEPVETVMTRKLVTCTREMRADQVLQKMTDGRFRHMPVLDDAGTLVGLISLGDVVKARLMELAMENDALEGMIRGH